jgi:hemolysin activation/secretion protein
LCYPFRRSLARTLIGRIGVEHKALTDQLDAFDVRSDKRIRNTVLGASWESRDGWLGGGFNGASAQFRWGHLGFGTDQQRQDDAALGAQGTGGSFSKAEWQFSRLQAVSREVALYANVSQQLASRNLDAAEKMSLGGPRAVRAYPTAEAASDEATLFNSELRWWLNPNWTVFALYDWARGRQTRDPAPGGDAGNTVILRGAGFGLVANYPQWATLKATLAWRGDRKPVTDTRDAKTRLYLQAQRTF